MQIEQPVLRSNSGISVRLFRLHRKQFRDWWLFLVILFDIISKFVLSEELKREESVWLRYWTFCELFTFLNDVPVLMPRAGHIVWRISFHGIPSISSSLFVTRRIGDLYLLCHHMTLALMLCKYYLLCFCEAVRTMAGGVSSNRVLQHNMQHVAAWANFSDRACKQHTSQHTKLLFITIHCATKIDSVLLDLQNRKH